MERVRVEQFEESRCKDCGWVNLIFLWGFSLKFLSGNSLQYVGIRGIYTSVFGMRKVRFVTNRVVWQLGLVTWLNRESELRVNCLAKLEVLSYNAPVDVTLQLSWMLHTCAFFGDLPAASQPRDLVVRPCWVHTLKLFFTLSHTLPLHESHLNIEFLNAELQANWYKIKPTNWLIKFNLT